MNFYHIDRRKCLSSAQQIRLSKIPKSTPNLTSSDKRLLEKFNYELSQHGIVYLSHQFDFPSSGAENAQVELVFEFVRQLYFPEKLSRFQSMFAFKKPDDFKRKIKQLAEANGNESSEIWMLAKYWKLIKDKK